MLIPETADTAAAERLMPRGTHWYMAIVTTHTYKIQRHTKKSVRGTLEHTGTDCGDTQIQNTKCKEIQNSKYVKIQIVDSRDTADTAGSSGEADAN